MLHGSVLTVKSALSSAKSRLVRQQSLHWMSKSRVHGPVHHIINYNNEWEWQQYAAIPDSRSNGEERSNADGCLDAVTRLVPQCLEDGYISWWNTIHPQYFPQ